MPKLEDDAKYLLQIGAGMLAFFAFYLFVVIVLSPKVNPSPAEFVRKPKPQTIPTPIVVESEQPNPRR